MPGNHRGSGRVQRSACYVNAVSLAGGHFWRTLAAVVVLVAGLTLSQRAQAQDKPTLSGSWSASALSEKWTITDWGDACGPKPKPQGAPGGAVQIREGGGELSIIGAGRAFSTSECWEQMPGVSRSSHSASGGGRFWRTKCSSAANDPRRTSIVTTISATDNSISMVETGTYQFNIQDATCNASVTRSRGYTLTHREGEAAPGDSASAAASASAPPPPSSAPPTPATASKPEPRPSRCTGSPGEPARLEVTPSKKLMRAGSKFAFRAVVLDSEGCGVSAPVKWSVVPGPLSSKAKIDDKGELSVEDGTEGKLEISASVNEKGITLPVEVATAETYDALLAASGLNDAGEAEQAVVAVIATGTIGGKTSLAEDAAKTRKMTFVAIVAGLALSLGFVGLVLARRGKKRNLEIEEEVEEEVEVDAPLPPAAEGESAPAPAPRERIKIKVKRKKSAAPRGKICPTCGERYGSEATFCGKDATKLVLLN